MGHPDDTTRQPPTVRPLRSMGEIGRIGRGWLSFIKGLERYGDAVEWSIGPMRETLLFHPDHAGEVFAAAGANGVLGRTLRRGFQEHAEIIGNNGLVMSEGPDWRRHRRILQPGMHRERLRDYAKTMVDFAEEMCDGWGAVASDGGAVRIQREMERLTRRIMTRTLFGSDLSQAESDEIKRVMDRQLLLNGIEFVAGNWLPPTVPTPLRAMLRAASDRLKTLFAGVLTRRLNEPDELRIRRDADLLDMLLEARDEDGEPLPQRQLCDEMHNMFLGGYETSANTLGFIGVLLAGEPGLQERIRSEIDQAVGSDTLTFEHTTRLPIVEAVVKEALRLYPPVFALPGHIVKSGITLCGYDFRPGQRLIVAPYVTQRDPRWFADPDVFRPDRWLDGSTEDIPRFAWMPFGGGPRVCYGQQFAMAEMILTLAVIARRFVLAPSPRAGNEVRARLSPSFMLRVKDDKIRLTRRPDQPV